MMTIVGKSRLFQMMNAQLFFMVTNNKTAIQQSLMLTMLAKRTTTMNRGSC